MSLLLYSKIPGTQVKRDANLSNATVQCDPTLLFPQGATQGGVPLNKENLAGKIAVEHDICNLDVNNLTVNGVLVAKGPAEICNIVCPDTFSVVAEQQVSVVTTAVGVAPIGNIKISATGGLTLGSETSGRETAIRAGNIISIGSAGGNSQGINMNFGTVDTDSLKITQANGTVAQAQAGNVNGVCGKLNVDGATPVLAGAVESFPIPNGKVTANSVVLVTLDTTTIAAADFLITSTASIINGQYTLNIANITAGTIDIDQVIIHYLVINPVV